MENELKPEEIVSDYKYGFNDSETAVTRFDKGLSEKVVRDISELKNEPDWMSPDIIKSRTLAREILKRKVDTDRLGKQKPLIQVLTYGDTKPQKPFRILEMDAVDILLDQISVSEDITTGIIKFLKLFTL